MPVKKARMTDSPVKIQWHPGFYGAAELELRANASDLTFQTELELSKKPLVADLMVIKAKPGIRVENEIGRIFRRYNLIEYKSPEDGLSIDDFYKTIGYACLYKSSGTRVNQYPGEEITVSIFRDTNPRELKSVLEASGMPVKEEYPGIYYISGRLPFAVQVVVTSRLRKKGHSALRVLSNHASLEDMKRFIEDTRNYTTKGDIENAEAVLHVSLSANEKLYDEIRGNSSMYDTLEYLVRDSIEKARMEGAQEAKQEERLNNTQKNIRSLMTTLNMTAEEAMDALQIPQSERELYLSKLR